MLASRESSITDYELLDFGEGRKLERFGDIIVDRPSPAAEDIAKLQRERWKQTNVSYQRISNQRGDWNGRQVDREPWNISVGKLHFELRLAPTGQVGIFPEQQSNWEWISKAVQRLSAVNDASSTATPIRILNLFAYTGGSTLAASQANVEVVHVDAAKPAVQWARRNAELNELADNPIRWIVDDVRKFVRRELKRDQTYHGVILDPPSYGHGKKGEAWMIDRDLDGFLYDCCKLLSNEQGMIVLSCHSPGWDSDRLRSLVTRSLKDTVHTNQLQSLNSTALDLMLRDSSDRRLPSGQAVRCTYGIEGLED